uniref:Superoxide dismutase [Cu-Zn] n=1 Tax=Megathura crenulata TaxID=55429 RepID=Q5GR13_MEGCR|nr:superoxide dismutase [Cu-Zn] [Megathura crenulata]
MKLWYFLLVVVAVLNADAKKAKKTRGRGKDKSGGSMAELDSLKKNLSALWTEVNDFGSSRVMVHVHGMGDDDADTHHDGAGTHVHIHMHLDDEKHHGHHGHGHGSHEHGKEKGGHGMDHGSHGDVMHHGSHGDGMHHGGHHGSQKHGNDEGAHGMHHGMHGMGHGQYHSEMKNPGMMKSNMDMMSVHAHLHHPESDEYMYARCEMGMNPVMANTPHNIQGTIFLRQKIYQPLEVLLHLKGFDVPAGDHDHSGHAAHMGHTHHTDHTGHAGHVHGFHVHEFGDMSNGCNSFGGHYNPDKVDHSGHESDTRHAGDWGNIECDMKGEVHADMNDTITSLVGPHSIIGRGIVIHMTHDDLGTGGDQGSLATGNAGARLACCTVAWSADLDWDQLRMHHDHQH